MFFKTLDEKYKFYVKIQKWILRNRLALRFTWQNEPKITLTSSFFCTTLFNNVHCEGGIRLITLEHSKLKTLPLPGTMLNEIPLVLWCLLWERNQSSKTMLLSFNTKHILKTYVQCPIHSQDLFLLPNYLILQDQSQTDTFPDQHLDG